MTSRGVALVTGAARGIGRTIARRLADDGYDIAINDPKSSLSELDNVTKEIGSKGRNVVRITADITEEVQVKEMIPFVVEKLGGLDVMVANAGICPLSPLVETSSELLDNAMAVNVRGTMLCYKYAAKQMIAQGRGGRIVGASSVAGKRPFLLGSAYVASKFAVRGLTQVAAMELGKHGITVNAYAPGFIKTEMLEDVERSMNMEPGAFVEASISTLAIPRLGETEDIAELVSFLVSKKAGYITGQTFSSDGGWL
ncbi:hypothetical protein HETIRDRAFT_106091 [Heterobasidion irregulare TC 32-1]|uniref:3-oxoacyl-[acyl-carrier-protein] reductase n=1 Tax=Heterobasidion irregulare (strain TC 32-1) TaxID=747525 RepID=W4JT69_HETIT|nr:uncharacterized protein HETIRDRAFT_106091 [Heterobasidion irregulare TC 32-1]ETW76659.1 hypothetical protein HETIRDRAFT_106091 [Heterobasidion irregulare TC 32-1]